MSSLLAQCIHSYHFNATRRFQIFTRHKMNPTFKRLTGGTLQQEDKIFSFFCCLPYFIQHLLSLHRVQWNIYCNLTSRRWLSCAQSEFANRSEFIFQKAGHNNFYMHSMIYFPLILPFTRVSKSLFFLFSTLMSSSNWLSRL